MIDVRKGHQTTKKITTTNGQKSLLSNGSWGILMRFTFFTTGINRSKPLPGQLWLPGAAKLSLLIAVPEPSKSYRSDRGDDVFVTNKGVYRSNKINHQYPSITC